MKTKALHTKNLDELSQFAVNEYDIGIVRSVSTLSGGYSRVFRIESARGSFVLKEMAPDCMNSPWNEPAVNCYLKENGFPVSSFINGRDGKPVREDGGMVYHLQTLEHGRALARNTASPSFMKHCAATLGRLHAALERYPSLPEGMDKTWCEGINSTEAEAFHRSSIPWAEREGSGNALDLLRWKIDNIRDLDAHGIDFSLLTRGNTHGDFHICQLLEKDGQISAVLDFTGAGRLPLCWEVIRSCCYADPACANGNIDLKNLKNYVSAYLSEHRLSRYDLEKMADFYYFQLLACNYFNQAQHCHGDNFAHVLDITIWAAKICRTLRACRREIGRELAGLA